MAESALPEIHRKFDKAVNMTAVELEAWLETDESKMVGWKGRNGRAVESVGRRSGRRILEILDTPRPELSPDDFAHMRKVIGFIARHTAQGPARDKTTSRWRYSLMNWGHDPLKG